MNFFRLIRLLLFTAATTITIISNNNQGVVIAAAAVNTDCYNDWSKLKSHIQSRRGGLFRICPNTIFRLDERDYMYISNVVTKPLTIQCGYKGRLSDDCVIDGGLHHLWIADQAKQITVRGLTFQNAQRGSVWHACCDVHVRYENCLWKDNLHVDLESTSAYMDGAAAINGYDADVSFTNCTFLVRESLLLCGPFESSDWVSYSNFSFLQRNKGQLGAISLTYSRVRFDRCTFRSNVARDVYSKWKDVVSPTCRKVYPAF